MRFVWKSYWMSKRNNIWKINPMMSEVRQSMIGCNLATNAARASQTRTGGKAFAREMQLVIFSDFPIVISVHTRAWNCSISTIDGQTYMVFVFIYWWAAAYIYCALLLYWPMRQWLVCWLCGALLICVWRTSSPEMNNAIRLILNSKVQTSREKLLYNIVYLFKSVENEWMSEWM